MVLTAPSSIGIGPIPTWSRRSTRPSTQVRYQGYRKVGRSQCRTKKGPQDCCAGSCTAATVTDAGGETVQERGAMQCGRRGRRVRTLEPASGETLRGHNRRIYRAWRLNPRVRATLGLQLPWAAMRFFKRWTTSALRRTPSNALRKVRSTTARRHQLLANALPSTAVTNAVAPSISTRIVKIVKNRASGLPTSPRHSPT